MIQEKFAEVDLDQNFTFIQSTWDLTRTWWQWHCVCFQWRCEIGGWFLLINRWESCILGGMWRSEMGGCSYNARESSADLQVSVPPHTFCVKKFLNVTFWMCTTHYTQSSPPYSAFCNFLILFLYAYSINMTFSWPFLFLRFCWCYIGVTAFF